MRDNVTDERLGGVRGKANLDRGFRISAEGREKAEAVAANARDPYNCVRLLVSKQLWAV